MRKPTKGSMTRKLDKLCSELVRARGQCAWCHKTEGLECCHIFSRKYRSVRWDMLNLIPLCHQHHFYAHSNPVFFTEFVKGYMHEYDYNLLKFRAKQVKKWTIPEMEELYKSLQTLAGKKGA